MSQKLQVLPNFNVHFHSFSVHHFLIKLLHLESLAESNIHHWMDQKEEVQLVDMVKICNFLLLSICLLRFKEVNYYVKVNELPK